MHSTLMLTDLETFSGNHASSIREEGKIYSATRDGKVSWVSTEDVGSVAHRALTNEPAENTANVLLGPELLSYDDVRASTRPLRLVDV